jgi:hypothetical protein
MGDIILLKLSRRGNDSSESVTTQSKDPLGVHFAAIYYYSFYIMNLPGRLFFRTAKLSEESYFAQLNTGCVRFMSIESMQYGTKYHATAL